MNALLNDPLMDTIYSGTHYTGIVEDENSIDYVQIIAHNIGGALAVKQAVPKHQLYGYTIPVEGWETAFVAAREVPTRSLSQEWFKPVGSHLDQKWRSSLKQEVSKLFDKAQSPNWDGEDALPLVSATVDLTHKIIDAFPPGLYNLEKPDVRVTPHGEVSFDWVVSQKAMFSVGVLPSGRVACSGLFPDSRMRGNKEWNGGELPKIINCGFEQLREAQVI